LNALDARPLIAAVGAVMHDQRLKDEERLACVVEAVGKFVKYQMDAIRADYEARFSSIKPVENNISMDPVAEAIREIARYQRPIHVDGAQVEVKTGDLADAVRSLKIPAPVANFDMTAVIARFDRALEDHDKVLRQFMEGMRVMTETLWKVKDELDKLATRKRPAYHIIDGDDVIKVKPVE
jgi:hypothetical protein